MNPHEKHTDSEPVSEPRNHEVTVDSEHATVPVQVVSNAKKALFVYFDALAGVTVHTPTQRAFRMPQNPDATGFDLELVIKTNETPDYYSPETVFETLTERRFPYDNDEYQLNIDGLTVTTIDESTRRISGHVTVVETSDE